MKKNELVELHSKTVDELHKEIDDLRKQLNELRLDYSLNKEKNTAKKKELGRVLAQNLTVLSEKNKNVIQSASSEVEEKGEKSS